MKVGSGILDELWRNHTKMRPTTKESDLLHRSGSLNRLRSDILSSLNSFSDLGFGGVFDGLKVLLRLFSSVLHSFDGIRQTSLLDVNVDILRSVLNKINNMSQLGNLRDGKVSP